MNTCAYHWPSYRTKSSKSKTSLPLRNMEGCTLKFKKACTVYPNTDFLQTSSSRNAYLNIYISQSNTHPNYGNTLGARSHSPSSYTTSESNTQGGIMRYTRSNHSKMTTNSPLTGKTKHICGITLDWNYSEQ